MPEVMLIPEPIWVAEIISTEQPILITESITMAQTTPTTQPELIELLAIPDANPFPIDDPHLN